MFTKPVTAFTAALLAGSWGLACQPQWVDRAVRDSIDVKRSDAAAAPGTGGSGFDAGPFDLGGGVDSAKPPGNVADADDARINPATGGARGTGAAGGTGGGQGGAGGAATSPGAGGVAGNNDLDARADVAAEDARPGPTVDAAPDGPLTNDQLMSALLAITPPTCAMKAASNFDLDAPGTPGAGKADICGINGAFYWVADMNIDCDGRDAPVDKCPAGNSSDTYAHNNNKQALAPEVTPFVVLPASAANPDLPAVNLKPGSIVAVINQQTHKMVFAVFGDTDSDSRIGAASYACAEQLGIDPSPVTGGQRGATITYVAFTDPSAVPRNIENQMEAQQLGQMLATKLIVATK